MKFLFDLFPVILFFGMYKWGESNTEAAQSLVARYLSSIIDGGTVTALQAPILLATAVAILATVAQIGYLLIRRKKVDGMLWLSLVIIGIFGGATIYFHNDTFIKWKPTVLYWCFGGALVLSEIFMKKNLIRIMMEKQIGLPDPIWRRLNLAWGFFFIALGVLNIYIALNFSTSIWVDFKLFGTTGLMFVFIVGQTILLSKHLKDPNDRSAG